MSDYEIIDVDSSNLHKTGFFCYMSKPKSPGYRQKQAWLEQRFAEGLRLKLLHETGGRDVAFIEYIPGEYTWRTVEAPGYLVIHCLWVVGKGKGKGYARKLLEACIEDARAQGKLGVVMITSDGNWLASKQVFLHHGFEEIAQAPLSFQLLVYRLQPGPEPSFPTDWQARSQSFGAGLTVLRSPQCPYIENACQAIVDYARQRGIPARVVSFETAEEARRRSPSPYGVFGVIQDGQLISYTYMEPKHLDALIHIPG